MKLEEKVAEYVKLEEEIINEIYDKKNTENPCKCDEPYYFFYVDDWDNGVMTALCINCGGYKEEQRWTRDE